MATAVQNVTLKMPRELLERARVTAAKQGTSIDHLCIEGLERLLTPQAALTSEEETFLSQFSATLDQLIADLRQQNRQLEQALKKINAARSR